MFKIREILRKVANTVDCLVVVSKVKLLVILAAVIGLGSLCAFSVKNDICSEEQHVFCSETGSTCHGTEDGICPDCAGKGMVKCSNCLGKGELRESCNKCNGHGTIREVCGSEIIGTRACPNCFGGYDGGHKCYRCRGTGTENVERSKYCYRNCNACFGAGFLMIACSNCNQTGLKPCTKCNSTGRVN